MAPKNDLRYRCALIRTARLLIIGAPVPIAGRVDATGRVIFKAAPKKGGAA